MTEIAVEVPEPEPSDDDTTVVIVNNDDDGDKGAEQDLALLVGQLSAQVAELQSKVEAVSFDASSAQLQAEIATDIAIDAQEENAVEEAVIEDLAEEVAEDNTEVVEEDNPPAKVPWTHRSMRDLFGHE